MVRRILGVALVAAALAPASADELAPSARGVVHLHREERPARNDDEAIAWGTTGDMASSPLSLEESLIEATQAAETSRWQATVTAVRVPPRASGAARFAAGTRPLAAAADLAALRASIAAGDASVEHRVEASGPCGATRHASDAKSTSVRVRDDHESAIGASVVWGVAAAAKSGLDVRIETAPSGDGRWRTRVLVVWSGAPEADVAPWLEHEDVDRVRVQVFAADVSFDVRGGETAVLRAADTGGDTRIILVRIDGDAPDVPLVREFSPAWIVAPADLVHDEDDLSAWPVDDGPPTHADGETDRTTVVAPAASVAAWRPGVIGVFRAARLADGTADELRAGLALRRGTGAVEVARTAGPRIVLPVAPGTLFRGFTGEIETARRGLVASPACEECLLVRSEVAVEAFGLGVTGGAWPDGSVDLDVVARTLLAETMHDATASRGLPGYQTTAPLALRLPIRRVRETSFGGCAGPGASRLGRDLTAQFVAPDEVRGRPDPWARPAPVGVRVAGGHLPMRPGRGGRLVERTLRSFVRRWASEGWCGMRARFPVVDEVVEGSDASLRLAADSRSVSVVAEVRGAPDVQGSVDPLDGAVTVVRSPFLRFAADGVVPSADGRVAWAGPLALTIGLPPAARAPGTDHDPAVDDDLGDGPRAASRITFGGGAAGCVMPDASRGVFETGGETVLPTEQDCTTSNHGTGEVRTGFRVVLDGTRATLGAPGDDGVRRLDVEHRSPPAWTQHVLTKSTVPPRDGETGSGLVYVRRALRRASFLVVPSRGFRRAADGAPGMPEIVVARDGDTAGERR